jgi:hypothetical protein
MNNDIQLIFERYTQTLQEDTLDTGTMTVEQLKDYLLPLKGTTAVNVLVEAPLKMNKKSRVDGAPNPYIGTVKQSVISGIAGGDYELAVQNKELTAHETDPNYMPSFKSAPIWHGKGERVSPMLVQHVDTKEYYLVIGSPKSGSSTYIFNGKPIDKTVLEPFAPPAPAGSQKQTDAGIAVENQQTVRYPMLRNIKKIKINNVDITIT